MECRESIDTATDYLRRFNRAVFEQRVPLAGSLALTHRCNLRCGICYVRSQNSDRTLRDRELKTEVVRRILDEAVEAGCLSLLLTGGEPLLRDDFAVLYRHAKARGMLVTVFTNGTLITDAVLDLFSELPPRCVEITVYGATAGVHEAMTGAPGSFRRCRDGIRALRKRGTNVRLKTILTVVNRHELDGMRAMAAEDGLKFRFDACVFPRLDGDRTPVSFRVPADEAVRCEFEDSDRAQEWAQLFRRQKGTSTSDRLYRCGAGTTAFQVDPSGCLRPCLMARGVGMDLLQMSFAEGWRLIGKHMENRRIDVSSLCRTCEKGVLCGYCPGFFELETGAEMRQSEYLCDMGRHRLERVRSLELEGNGNGSRNKEQTGMQVAV